MAEQVNADDRSLMAEFADDRPAEEVTGYYDDWISNKDNHYDDLIGHYHGPTLLVQHLKPHLEKLPRLSRVLDVGAGSGYVALELRTVVDQSVIMDALEPSVKMREAAQKENIYSHYYTDFLNGLNSTKIDSEQYDLVCTSGCFGPSHIPAEGTMEMLRLTKIGGLMGIVMRESYIRDIPAYKGKFMELLQRLEEEGVAQKLDVSKVANYFGDHPGLVLIYRKTGKL